jgi:hypothetical protein
LHSNASGQGPEAEAASNALNMCADKESREFKKQKSMTKQSL